MKIAYNLNTKSKMMHACVHQRGIFVYVGITKCFMENGLHKFRVLVDGYYFVLISDIHFQTIVGFRSVVVEVTPTFKYKNKPSTGKVLNLFFIMFMRFICATGACVYLNIVH